jgi:CDP-glycerol glycerophosphotransferase (TagB/SpsB family)
VAEIFEALNPRFADFHITMKLHPGENAALYRKFLADRLPSSIEISDRGNLEELIAESDIIISPPSTVVIEARACGKNVILIPVPTVEGRKTTLTEASGVITVQRIEELVPTIESILSDVSELSLGQWPLEQFLGPLDGGSSRRLLKEVIALAIKSNDTAKVEMRTSLEKSHAVH